MTVNYPGFAGGDRTDLRLPATQRALLEALHAPGKPVVLVLTGGIGLVTPPVGSVLFIGTAIGKITIAQSMRTIWPFWLAGLAVLLVVALFPDLSLWLPRALKG